MDKRTFLKLSSVAIAGTALGPLASCAGDKSNQTMNLKNWAGNLTYSTGNIFEPSTTEEVREIVTGHKHLRALGTRHCFNRIADSNENLLSTKNLNQVLSLDEIARTVTVGAGIRYGEFCKYIHERGFAIHNLASLPHISVAGACTTATHGSGVRNGNLSTSVRALEFVGADGTIHRLAEKDNAEKFMGVVVGLGAIGIITKVTLALQPSFSMRQFVFEELPLSELSENFTKIMSAGYSVSLFTD